jgi:hypothetical protein
MSHMKLHILVEGSSEEAFLRGWLPRFLPAHSFSVITHQGKGRLSQNIHRKPDPRRRGLLDQLPLKLKAYGKSLNPNTDRVVVLVDADDDDCTDLLNRMNRVLDVCSPKPIVLFRIAIEETEAFFLGDQRALKLAYPKAKIARLRGHEYDSVLGTWELLRSIIGASPDSDDKVAWAEAISPHLGIVWQGARANKSPSFRKFCEGLKRHVGEKVK